MHPRLSNVPALLPAMLVLAGVSIAAHAQAPRTIGFQGRLTNASGAPKPDGTYGLTFRLYSAPTGGTALWTETQPSVPVANGTFATTLGAASPFPATLHFDAPYYLGVQVTGEAAEMTPRLPLQSVPYALALYGLHTEVTAATPNILAGYSGNQVTPGVVGATVSGGGAALDILNNPAPNRVTDDYGTVSGGYNNQAGNGPQTPEKPDDAQWATVGGGISNTAGGSYATVAGGFSNNASGEGAFVGSGNANLALGAMSVIAGGQGNIAAGGYSAVGGGGPKDGDFNRVNRADADYSVVAGGGNNHASVGDSGHGSANFSTVSGGGDNWARNDYATVAGGNVNYADGTNSMVAGGEFNSARGRDSLAAGHQAQANHDGAFVWADNHSFDFDSTTENEFGVRATGGVRLVTGIDNAGAPTASLTLNPGGDANGHFLDTSTHAYLTIGGEWTNASDRALKFAVSAVDPKEVLDRVTRLPVTAWSYKAEGLAVRHMGPMAQDFTAAFHLGQDDRHIGTVDATGVALAAIQGLARELKERDAEIARLKAEDAAKMAALEARLRRLERALGTATPRR